MDRGGDGTSDVGKYYYIDTMPWLLMWTPGALSFLLGSPAGSTWTSFAGEAYALSRTIGGFAVQEFQFWRTPRLTQGDDLMQRQYASEYRNGGPQAAPL